MKNLSHLSHKSPFCVYRHELQRIVTASAFHTVSTSISELEWRLMSQYIPPGSQGLHVHCELLCAFPRGSQAQRQPPRGREGCPSVPCASVSHYSDTQNQFCLEDFQSASAAYNVSLLSERDLSGHLNVHSSRYQNPHG